MALDSGSSATDQSALLPAAVTGDQLVVPYSGEVVDLEEPAQCVRVLAEIRELERRLRQVKDELTFHLSEEFKRQGTKTLEFAGIRAELKGGSEIAWDIEVLEELRGLGLPEERFNKLIQAEITYKVSGAEAKRIAGANPQYAEVIERAKRHYAKPHRVYIRQ